MLGHKRRSLAEEFFFSLQYFSRLLNVDLDAWVHLNCALWSYEVYETQNGALMNVGDAIKRGEKTVINHNDFIKSSIRFTQSMFNVYIVIAD